MNLTPGQLTTLATDINGRATLATARANHDAPAVCNFYNAAGASNIWRSDCTPSQLVAVANWVSFKALTVATQNVLFAMLLANPIDATQQSVRSGFSAVFTGADLTAISNAAQRVGTIIENLFATGGPPAVCGVDAAGLTLYGQPLDTGTVTKAMGW